MKTVYLLASMCLRTCTKTTHLNPLFCTVLLAKKDHNVSRSSTRSCTNLYNLCDNKLHQMYQTTNIL